MHFSQHKLCARKTELALIMEFYVDFAVATNAERKNQARRRKIRINLWRPVRGGGGGGGGGYGGGLGGGGAVWGRVWKKFPVDL